MLLEEFYSYDARDDKRIADYVYIHTLSCWLINNDFSIYETLLEHYEDQEMYAICEGINRGLNFIEDTMNLHFEDAEKMEEKDGHFVYTHQEHMRVSALIFQDIIKEIYEKQIGKFKENNR